MVLYLLPRHSQRRCGPAEKKDNVHFAHGNPMNYDIFIFSKNNDTICESSFTVVLTKNL